MILDNCEHLGSACAQLSEALLQACPHVKILASSREALNIAGELTYRVPSLSLPTRKESVTVESLNQYEAVRLFIERALFHLPVFAVTNQNAPALASICYRLDGIPLAIEMAAARVRSLSVEEIDNRLDDRFRLLTGGIRTALPRQQTLRAAIDWSYGLISDQERLLLQYLSVFMGDWSLEAAENICAFEDIKEEQILDLLASLVDKSLVSAEHHGEHTRYRLLETMKQYCRERLEEGDKALAVQRRHRDYYLRIAEEAESLLVGVDRIVWFDLLEREHDNLRSALDFCYSDGNSITVALRLAGALWRFWEGQGYVSEGRSQLETALSRSENVATLQKAKVLLGAAMLTRHEGNEKQARILFQECLILCTLLGAKRETAWALLALGDIARQIGSDNEQAPFERMTTLCQEAMVLFRETGDKQGLAQCLRLISVTSSTEEQASMLEESLRLSQESGDTNGVAATLYRQASIMLSTNIEQAKTLLERALAINEAARNKKGMALVLGALSIIAAKNGVAVDIRIDLYVRAVALCREIGNKKQAAQYLMLLGNIGNDADQKTHCLLEAVSLCQEIDIPEWQATCFDVLGRIAQDQREYERARSYYVEAMTLRRRSESPGDLLLSLKSFALFAAATGQSLKGIRLLATMEANSAIDPFAEFLSEEDETEQFIVEVRSQLSEDIFIATWEQGRAMTLEQSVAYALDEVTL